MFSRTFFVTTVTARRFPLFRNEATARLLMETLLHYEMQKKYELHAFVVMPDHVHLLLTPSPEISLERAVQFVKGGFSYRLHIRGTVWQESELYESPDSRRGGFRAAPGIHPHESRRSSLGKTARGLSVSIVRHQGRHGPGCQVRG
jgi:REP element-mobilizing transposase RayT